MTDDLLKYPDPSLLKSLIGNCENINQMLVRDCGTIPDPESKEKVALAATKMQEAIALWQEAIETIDRHYQVECDRLKAEVMAEVGGKEWLEWAGSLRIVAQYRAKGG